MSEKMDELERLAREAAPVAPGPYRVEHVRHMQHDIYDADSEEIAGYWHHVVSEFAAACSPERILALAAVARAAVVLRDGDGPEAFPRSTLWEALAALERL